MRVPDSLSRDFGQPFEEFISRFAFEQKLLSEADAMASDRFLTRSILPHVRRLSSLFNREEREQDAGLHDYWHEGSNPAHLRLAYFLYFMPANLFRVASVWTELSRLGYRWPSATPFSLLEIGAGPASGTAGIAAGEKHAPLGIPKDGRIALIEQDQAALRLGAEWVSQYAETCGLSWKPRTFHRSIDFSRPLLPPTAPRFGVWLMSYVLNETSVPTEVLARSLLRTWERHLEDESLVILVEPALRLQSRKLLELRQELIKKAPSWLRVLLPCLGTQACAALASEDDWCHEEVSWWRPPYVQRIDRMASLDRKTLPFSYLVLAKTRRSTEELLPALTGTTAQNRFRLVSPSHEPAPRGRDVEFYICGADGKRRARYAPGDGPRPERGDLLLGAEVHGDIHASRIQRVKTIG